MKIYARTLNACHGVKEANLKRLHNVRFQLYDILEEAKLWRQEDQWLPRIGGRERRDE